ncbi:acyl-CoA thioesterase II [Neolewinella antarctica]|uniref:Acyl-CoA thioesterase-2 n=1 Tax=Neolewinella antarctica TaxID=442734 RepID=A0ABX0X9U1_9BACT|nr:acyl-CoA thioesterase II [Neolewinella antarctica]NJC26040.1 acyl-CoA thioesterase-2 [Neolewinella antarctica]
MQKVSELLNLLDLERLEVNLFRGESRSIGSPRVFGGQVLAQSLAAAIKTVAEDRFVHSLHGYFVLPGDLDIPIIFEVDRIRDGGSFTTRAVKAIQNGAAIFHLTASFQKTQEGYDHQATAPDVLRYDELVSYEGMAKQFGEKLPENIRKMLAIKRPLEFRPVEFLNPFANEKYEPIRNVWLKTNGEMGDDRHQHELVLAYASDYNLLTTALLPHGKAIDQRNIQMASLDHAMWFHRPFRADEWLLYSIDSPSASGGRGFTRGNIFDAEGKLVASVVQEGLMRKMRR